MGTRLGFTNIDRQLQKANLSCIELRVEHRHGVSPKLAAKERATVKQLFTESGLELVGFGTNFCFHTPDAQTLRANIEGAKEYVLLSRDCGASGVKVKPNDLPKNVAQEKTMAQIAASLNELGRFAADYGQEIRLEVHGGCSPIPIIKTIIDQVTEKNVGLCWNCNKPDLDAPGLQANFESVKNRLGQTVHIRALDSKTYPTRELFELLHAARYTGCLLIEEGNASLTSEERVQQLTNSAAIFEKWKKEIEI
jgi:sugar phosphate isomerase/epimerase